MSNYISVHKPSQLIQTVIASSISPSPSKHYSFHEVSIIVLNHYYKLYKKALAKGIQVSIGELMHSCPSLHDQVSKGKQGKVQLVTTRIRNELTPTIVDRASTIRDWIKANPSAGPHDLSDRFLTGTVVAKAYLSKYR
jgi:hypothetical protein